MKKYSIKTDSVSRIGTLIKTTRKSKKLTQEDLEEMCGVDSHTISKIERSGSCTLSTLLAVCNALGIEMYLDAPVEI